MDQMADGWSAHAGNDEQHECGRPLEQSGVGALGKDIWTGLTSFSLTLTGHLETGGRPLVCVLW